MVRSFTFKRNNNLTKQGDKNMETIWERIKDATDKSIEKLHQYKDIAKDATGKGMKKINKYTDIAMDKAEESAEMLKLKLKRLQLERRIYKNLAMIGSGVYEAVRKEKKNLKDMPKVGKLLKDTKKLDEKLVQIATILDERSKT